MNSISLRSFRYEFLRKRSYPLLWHPYMCDLFMNFAGDVAPEEILHSSELLDLFREGGVRRGLSGAPSWTLQEVLTGCSGRPLIYDFVWRGVIHVVCKLLRVPRSNLNQDLIEDLQQELFLLIAGYEKKFNPDAEGTGGKALLEVFYFAFPVKKACDRFKHLLFGGNGILSDLNPGLSLEAERDNGPYILEGKETYTLEKILRDKSSKHAGSNLDSAMLSEKIVLVMRDCTPKERDILVLCLLLLGVTDKEAARRTGISNVGIWHRRQDFTRTFARMLQEKLAERSLAGLDDRKDLVNELCYGRADGRSAIDSRITGAPEVESIQWDRLDAVWDDFLSDGNEEESVVD